MEGLFQAHLNDGKTNPRDIKRALARKLVEMYHSKEAAENAEAEFDKIFIKKGIPDDIEEIKIDTAEMEILDLIVKLNFAPSRGEARRLVTQGGVSLDNEKIIDLSLKLPLHRAAFNNFMPLPGSEIYERLIKEGKISHDSIKWDLYQANRIAYSTDGISERELKGLLRKAYRKFYFRPSIFLRLLKEDIHSLAQLKTVVSRALDSFK